MLLERCLLPFLNGDCKYDVVWWHHVGYWIISQASNQYSCFLSAHLTPPRPPCSTQQTWMESCHFLAQSLQWFPTALQIIFKLIHAYESVHPWPLPACLTSFLTTGPLTPCSRHKSLIPGVSRNHRDFPGPRSSLTYWEGSSLTSLPKSGGRFLIILWNYSLLNTYLFYLFFCFAFLSHWNLNLSLLLEHGRCSITS